jgi:hypothetical protein
MRGTGIEKAVEICATNITNKTKCMSTNAKKWKFFVKTCSNTTNAICGVKAGVNACILFSHLFKIILISNNGITIAVRSSGLEPSVVRRERDIPEKRVASVCLSSVSKSKPSKKPAEAGGKPSRLSWYGIAHIARARARGFLRCLFPGITSTQFMSPHMPLPYMHSSPVTASLRLLQCSPILDST